jgi:MFS family permease
MQPTQETPADRAPSAGVVATEQSVIIPNRWRKLAAVAAALWSDNNETSVLSTLSPVIIKSLGLQNSAVGLLVSISKAISIVFGPLWAWIARKTNRKGALVVSTLMVALFTAACGLSQNFTQLVILWSLAAVFIAAGLPIVSEITADLFDEKSRGRASGYTWGAIALIGSVLGPLIGQLSRIPDGWRIGFFVSGGIGVLVTLFVIFGFKDPGVGASEPALRDLTAEQRAEHSKLTWAKIGTLVRIPTFLLMLGQRLISGHLLIGTFGVLFLVQEYGFSTAVAAVVTLPFGIGYLVGTFGGGIVVDALQARHPRYARVAVLQAAQFAFALFALLGTQINWHSIAIFGVFWALMGMMQGINPGVNRPIVMAVVPPELRGAAFALMLSVFEALAFVIYNLSAGFLSDTFGLKAVMFWIPGILMIVNGAYCTLLYFTYPKDVARLQARLDREAHGVPTTD